MSHPPIQFLSNTPPPIDDFEDKDECEDGNFSNFEDNTSDIQPAEEETCDFKDVLNEDPVFPQTFYRTESPPSLDHDSSSTNSAAIQLEINFPEDLSIPEIPEDTKSDVEFEPYIRDCSDQEDQDSCVEVEIKEESEKSETSDFDVIKNESINESNQEIDIENDVKEISSDVTKEVECGVEKEQLKLTELEEEEVVEEKDDFCEFVDFNSAAVSLTQSQSAVDDDFADFDEIIPVHRNVETEIFTQSDPVEAPEEINFSVNFDAFSETDQTSSISIAKEEFKELPKNAPAVQEKEKVEQPQEEDEDDDDFGEFSDFKTATFDNQIIEQKPSKMTLDVTDIVKILNELFPTFQSSDAEELEKLGDNSLMSNLHDIDSMKALEYQYNSSKSSETMIISLGIDNRNILRGAQWNCQMPRFAANLSLSPLEPTKTAVQHSPKVSKKLNETSFKEPAEVTVEWNKPVLGDSPETSLREDDYQPAKPAINQTQLKKSETDESISETQQIQIPQVTTDLSISNIDLNYLEYSKPTAKYPETTLDNSSSTQSETYQKKNELDEPITVVANDLIKPKVGVDPYAINLRTIKLPETHIFTPLKGSNTISQEVSTHSEEFLTAVGETRVFPLNNVTVKEYHDVEYNLSKADYDYQYFSSAPFREGAGKISLENNLGNSILKPEKVEVVNDNQNQIVGETQQDPIQTNDLLASLDTNKQNCDGIDDDFNDFQAAPISLPTIPKEPINLVINKKTEEVEEDEWSDFVSIPMNSNPTTISNSKSKTETNSTNDDDWSDFVAAPPINSIHNNKNNSSRQSSNSFLSNGPRFSSWNQPSLPPNAFSKNFYPSDNQFALTKDQNVAAVVPTVNNFINITNNFNYSRNVQNDTNTTIPPHQNNYQQKYPNYNQMQKEKTNISLLPDLDFSLPGNFINLPHNNSTNFLKK